jgi:predicted HicB family RNase H-like nuclease
MKKQELLQVRVDSAEKEAFALAADIAGIAMSAWVRERLRQNAARELEAAAHPIPFLKTKKAK